MLPSATEIICALGLEDHIVGVSHSCNFPPTVCDLPRVTSTRVPHQDSSETIDGFVRDHLAENDALYDLDMVALERLRPDFVVSQTLCDVCAVSTGDVLSAIQSLPSRPELIDLEPNTLNDVLDDIVRVGKRLGTILPARVLTADLAERRRQVAARSGSIPKNERPRVAFLEWLFPPFNGGHWNPELVELAGGIDLLGNSGEPSSTQDWPAIIARRPDVIFVACCGFRPERTMQDVNKLSRTKEWRQLPAVRNGRVYVMDGNAYFSCPGPRLIEGLEIMAHALHMDVHPKLWPQAPLQP